MKATERVRQALNAGWTPVLSDHGALCWFTFDRGVKGVYSNLSLYVGEHHVEVTVSPTGRSVRIFVDGIEVDQ